MWMRQEYKPNKCRFEQPFELEMEVTFDSVSDQLTVSGTDGDIREKKTAKSKVINLRLVQNYSALGATVWDGSIALAKMFDNRDLFPTKYMNNCRVIELGAGCGLVGLYTCLLGAKQTILTDQQCCIPVLEENMKRNIPKQEQTRIKVMEYSWGDAVDSLIGGGVFQLVLAAEVLYSADDSLLLAKCIPDLADKDARIFISLGRNRGGEQSFVEAMRKQGWSVREVRDKLISYAK